MNIGQKVRELRIAKNLTQEELADRSELSKGFISQLERDLTSPSIATLVDILQCLGTNLNEFFSDDEEEQVVFGDEDYFEKKDTDLKNTIEWIIPNAQRNMMEPIRLTLAPGGATYPDLPHEGEEFGYVLQGSVKIHVGNKVYKAKKGESFYFTPRAKHYIEASSSSGARLIWVRLFPHPEAPRIPIRFFSLLKATSSLNFPYCFFISSSTIALYVSFPFQMPDS